VVGGPGLFESRNGNLLIAAVHDAAVIEMRHTGFGVDAGDDHEVVCGLTLPRPVPDGFGIEQNDRFPSRGQLLLQRAGRGLDLVGVDAAVREQDRQVPDIGVTVVPQIVPGPAALAVFTAKVVTSSSVGSSPVISPTTSATASSPQSEVRCWRQ